MTEESSINNENLYKMALLIDIACVLQILESLFPHPIPGLRLGLSNMVTLVALVMMDFRSAMEIAVFRTLLSSLIIGSFMSPTFILSFISAVLSTMAMGFIMRFSRHHAQYRPSIIGISIVGALVHNMVQLYLAYLLLVRHTGIFVFFPWLCIGSLVMGWITGTVAGSVCRRLENYQHDQNALPDSIINDEERLQSYHYCKGSSMIHRLPAELKIIAMIFLSLFVLMVNDFRILWSLFLLMALIVMFSKISPKYLLARVGQFISLILIAFLLPLFFNNGTHTIFKINSFSITYEGLDSGGIIAMRIIFLILTSAIVIRTTSQNELTYGLTKVLIPLKYVGISEKRTASILSLSWAALPNIWDSVRNAIKKGNFGKVKNLRNLMPLLSILITDLYMEANKPESYLWKKAYQN